ncbi:ADP-ribosyl cyclase/cyclic ADP-ribose hydrolase 1-like [Poecilia reticulata]|uniref:ADP-ribosyl cyclase/cyclic ADP-ribose hydrolase 1-like n=1 Tax=Poecilia reticulata TaxID=8081 RepID=UPI0004A4DE46|nr:PREDICTED: ADP-ribosyl cyclase/cyclic ADP-ribose hydrolase 1-like [Poecilia reticulata]
MGFKKKLAIGVGLLFLAAGIVVLPAIVLSPQTSQFRETFMRKCQAFPETIQRCEQVLNTFEEAYVGQDPCNFPEEAYRRLFMENPFTHSCDKTMFWSDTKDLVHGFCKERTHFVSLENTLLGNIMDGLTWCGKKNSKDTFFYLCERCKNNTVSSFWVRASSDFADYACGHAHVLLNGEISKPFDPTSYFGAVEVKNLIFPRVNRLTVVLVIKNNNAACSHESLKDLLNVLSPNIHYRCHSVTRSKILECIKTGTTTDACWT